MDEKKSILIVDDDESTRRTLALIFGKTGYQAETAGTGREAIEKAQGKFFNLALLDIRLPDVEGVELIAPLKEMHPDMAVIMVTGYASLETAVQALNLGASGYITKPLDMAEVLSKVGDVLEKQRLVQEKRRAEEALRASESKYRTLVENIPQKIFVKDKNSVYVSANENYARDLGITPEAIAGKVDYDFFPRQLADKYRGDDQRIMELGKTEEIEEKYIQDGQEVWVQTIKTPIRNEQGDVVGILGIFWDITERKRAEEEIKRLYQQARDRAAELASLNRASQAITSSLDIQKVLDQIVDLAGSVVDAAYTSVVLTEEDDSLDISAENFREGPPIETRARPHGITRQIIASRQPLVFDEVSDDGTHNPAVVAAGVRSYAGLPLTVKDKVLGVLFVHSRTPVAFRDRLPLLTTFANQAAVAIANARLYDALQQELAERKRAEEQIQRQLQRLAALREIDMTITASLDLHVTLNVILERVIRHLGVDAATVLRLDPHTQTLEYAAGHGLRTRALQHTRLHLGQGYAGRAALERRTISVADGKWQIADRETERATISHQLSAISQEGFVAYFGVPLIVKGQVKGVLEVFHRTPLEPDPEWLDFLEALARQAAIAIDNVSLFDELQRSNVELTLAYDATIEGWARALELRARETEGHTQRVTELTVRLARAMGMSEAERVHVRRGALLHDIGKMGISDGILLKPGPLTDEEWGIMHRHPVYAGELLSPVAFLRPALDIPHCHHEKWDGTGYPRGLKGEQIPLAARIFAVVDVWDALRSDRPYRPAWPEEKALAYIHAQAGKHFDPQVVEVFFKLLEMGESGNLVA